jgi:2'-hydroxyisoflavone reductase
MRLLVIGGTVFVGRAVVEAALARGDEVTVFHRGLHGRGLFDGVEEILGDRETDLDRLAGRSWDAVVDTCGFRPEHVGASAAALADSVERYVFISTVGVYRDWPTAPVPGEEAPLHESDVDDYSELKAASERAAEAAMPGRVAQVRPGTIVGPHENIGRLPWWLRRMARGGRVMAPGPPDAPIQAIDVRDLAEFSLDAPPGAYNAISEPGSATWGELLEACRQVTGGHAELVWTDPARVLAEVEEPWSELPIWPSPGLDGLFAAWPRRALEAGLRTRPLAETVRDTWAWLSGPEGDLSEWRSELRAPGLDPAIERALLAEP